MRKPEIDFPKDVPHDLVVDGLDGFARRGKAMLCIEMINDVASDLATGAGPEYEETLAWVNDPRNIAAWLQLVDASPHVVPALQEALLVRPNEIKVACSQASRSYGRAGGDLSRFMEMMGMTRVSEDSVLGECEENDELAPAMSL